MSRALALALVFAPLAAAADPISVPRQPDIPPGLTGHNPLNLMFVGQSDATGYVELQNGRRVAAYPNLRAGIAAELHQLTAYQASGLTTVRQFVTRWVSDPAADLASYISDVSAAIGVSPDQPIDLHDPAIAAAFILAAQPHETGGPHAVVQPPLPAPLPVVKATPVPAPAPGYAATSHGAHARDVSYTQKGDAR